MSSTVRDIMGFVPGTVSEDQSAAEAAKTMVDLFALEIPVVDGEGAFRGMLGAIEMIWVMAAGEDPSRISVGELARREDAIAVDAPLHDVVRRIDNTRGRTVPVVEEGKLVGLVTGIDVFAYQEVERVLGPDVSALVGEISSNDEMCVRSRGAYLLSASSALRCVRQSLAAADKTRIASIMDLPSGHGRVLRMLKAAFPGAKLAACDLDRDGVDFCHRVLGATPIYSSENPDDVEINAEFDLIWCGSLFTHLSEDRWDGFLALFERALAPGGVVAFSTIDRLDIGTLATLGMDEDQTRELQRGYDTGGFGYVDVEMPDTGGDMPAEWGLTLAAPKWVEQQIARRPGLRLVDYAPRVWHTPVPLHDVFTCVRTG